MGQPLLWTFQVLRYSPKSKAKFHTQPSLGACNTGWKFAWTEHVKGSWDEWWISNSARRSLSIRCNQSKHQKQQDIIILTGTKMKLRMWIVVSSSCGAYWPGHMPCTEQVLQTRSRYWSWTDTKDMWTLSHNVLPVMCSVDTTDTLLQRCEVWAASRRPTGTHWLTQEPRITPHAAVQAVTRENLSRTGFSASPALLTIFHGYWLDAKRWIVSNLTPEYFIATAFYFPAIHMDTQFIAPFVFYFPPFFHP